MAAAALLVIFHPSAVAYAQEVRGYAPLLLLAPLVALLSLEGKRPWLLAAAVALGLLAHATLLALVVALALLAVKERAWSTLRGLAGGAALGLGLGAATLPAKFVLHGESGPDRLVDALALLATNDARLLHPAFAGPFFLLALVGATRAPRLALVTLATALLLALVPLLGAPFHARFALVLLPLIIALAGEGAARLAPGRRALLVAAPLALLLAFATVRRAAWETEPIGPALASVPHGRFEFKGLGAELMTSDPDPTHTVELFTREPTPFQGLYASVRVVPRK